MGFFDPVTCPKPVEGSAGLRAGLKLHMKKCQSIVLLYFASHEDTIKWECGWVVRGRKVLMVGADFQLYYYCLLPTGS
jgi:hypothetical protein